jgi:hypothetical protein
MLPAMTKRTVTSALLAVALTGGAVAPAFADGAASTRNVLLGGAAAAAGTLLIINHNKQVHQKYADDERHQAETQAQANDAQAAYAAERRAYENEIAVNGEYKREVATQHALIASLRKEVALQKAHADRVQASVVQLHPAQVSVEQMGPDHAAFQHPVRVVSTSWGWGQL